MAIASTPGCNATDLKCAHPPVLYEMVGDNGPSWELQFPAHAKKTRIQSELALRVLFKEVLPAEHFFSKDACYRTLTWGTAARFGDKELRGEHQHVVAITASMVERVRQFHSLPPREARKEGHALNILYIGRAGNCNRRNLCQPLVHRTSEWIRRRAEMVPITKDSDYAFTATSFKRSLEQLGTADVIWG